MVFHGCFCHIVPPSVGNSRNSRDMWQGYGSIGPKVYKLARYEFDLGFRCPTPTPYAWRASLTRSRLVRPCFTTLSIMVPIIHAYILGDETSVDNAPVSVPCTAKRVS
jgi:hypothetical protein